MLICPKCHLEYYADETVCAVDAHPLDKVEDPRIGKLVGGRYVLDAVLGVGGMATVFRAHHTLINRVVAVKLLHPYIARSTRTCERFAREARAASAIAHPNVIEVFDFGKMDDGVPYLVMELLQGSPLRKLIDGGPMPLDEVVEIVIQLARGLARAHDLGVAHRDVKPENAFVERLEDGSVLAKLVDFGIAYAKGDERLTDADTIVGTPQYVSPERLLGNESGAASDLYSVGVMLFEMVTGELPFHAEGLPGWVLAHLETPPPRPTTLRPDLPLAFERLILELLAKEPKDRPVDARAVIASLERLRPEVDARRSGRDVEPAPRAVAVDEPPEVEAESSDGEPSRASDAREDADSWAGADPSTPAPVVGTQSLTIERWHRRAAIIRRMLERVFPDDTAPPELRKNVQEVEAALQRMAKLRDARLLDQRRLSEIERASRDSRERLGRAVQSLGEVLSRARAELREAEAAIGEKRAEVADLEYQLGTLRDTFTKGETNAFESREALDAALAESGEEIERLRRGVGIKTLAVLSRVRDDPSVAPLLLELEESRRE